MDTWSVARLILDGSFAIVATGFVVFFLYRREKRIRTLIAQYVMKAADQAAPVMVQEARRETVSEPTVNHRPPMPRANRPALVAQYDSQRSFAPTAPAARKASRAEKYLEAVRMYRQGTRREDIEKNLGISFMELELLGQLK